MYFYLISLCAVLLSYSTNIQALRVLSGKYENFNIEKIYELKTMDLVEIMGIFTELQIFDFAYLLARNVILQCCLSFVFDFSQILTTENTIPRVSIFVN